MKKLFFNTLLVIITLLLISGCTTIRAVSVMNKGRIISDQIEECVIPFKLRGGHVIVVQVRINNAGRLYNFMLDTGALTVVSQKVAEDLDLPSGVEVIARDTTGGSKPMQLINLDALELGKMKIAECPAGIIDLSGFGGHLKDRDVNVDGLIGSNFLRYFKVTIDYKNRKLILSNHTDSEPIAAGTYRLSFSSEMQKGYAPTVECMLEDKIRVHGIIDTGAPFLATLPSSLVKKTKAYAADQVVKAKGNVWGAAFKASENNALLRISTMQMGALRLHNLPMLSLPHRQMLIGKKFLEKFLVTLNYPAQEMSLSPYEELNFKSNVYSFGAIVGKNDAGRTVVTAFWEGSSADKSGIHIGDELVMVDGKSVENLSPIEVETLYHDDSVQEIDIVYKDGSGLHEIKVKKELLLPPILSQ